MSTESEVLDLVGFNPVSAADLVERYRMTLSPATVARHLRALCARGLPTRQWEGDQRYGRWAYRRPERASVASSRPPCPAPARSSCTAEAGGGRVAVLTYDASFNRRDGRRRGADRGEGDGRGMQAGDGGGRGREEARAARPLYRTPQAPPARRGRRGGQHGGLRRRQARGRHQV
jgi:hypothetical protein